MRIEVTRRTCAQVAEQWGHDPNVRAAYKQKLADEIATKMRINDLIDFVVSKHPESGDTLITASVLVERTGDEK